MTIIKSGYRLTVTSWENDADNYKTVVTEGNSAEYTRYVVAMLTIAKDHGNMYEPSDRELNNLAMVVREVFVKCLKTIPGLAELLIERLELEAKDIDEFGKLEFDFDENDDLDPITDFYTELAGQFLGYSEGYWLRQLESIKVEFVSHDIDLEDVTAEFVSN